eukprot:5341927-Amphidinium_carterae.1
MSRSSAVPVSGPPLGAVPAATLPPPQPQEHRQTPALAWANTARSSLFPSLVSVTTQRATVQGYGQRREQPRSG